MSDNYILVSDLSDIKNVLHGKLGQTIYSVLSVHGFLDQKIEFSEKKAYEFLCQVLKMGCFEADRPKIAYIDIFQILPTKKKIKHLFLVTETGQIIDLLNWTSDLPINYSDWKYYEPKFVHKNPHSFDTTIFALEPTILWFSVLLAFFHNHTQDDSESDAEFVDRVYQEYKKKQLTRKEALSNSYNIALDTLYDKGVFVRDTRLITELGSQQEKALIQSKSDAELNRLHEIFKLVINGAMGGQNART